MRQCLALLCALAFFGLPLFLICFEGESLLGCPDAAYRWLDAWVPFVIILSVPAITLALPWIVELLGESDETA
jgi:hypothetical protein